MINLGAAIFAVAMGAIVLVVTLRTEWRLLRFLSAGMVLRRISYAQVLSADPDDGLGLGSHTRIRAVR